MYVIVTSKHSVSSSFSYFFSIHEWMAFKLEFVSQWILFFVILQGVKKWGLTNPIILFGQVIKWKREDPFFFFNGSKRCGLFFNRLQNIYFFFFLLQVNIKVWRTCEYNNQWNKILKPQARQLFFFFYVCKLLDATVPLRKISSNKT